MTRKGVGDLTLMHRHRISPLPSSPTPIRAPYHTLGGSEAGSHGRSGLRRPYQPQQNSSGSTSLPPKGAKVFPEGSKGLPGREQRSPPTGAKVSLMGFKVFSRAAMVSPEGSKGLLPKGERRSPPEWSEGLPPKRAKISPRVAKLSPQGC